MAPKDTHVPPLPPSGGAGPWPATRSPHPPTIAYSSNKYSYHTSTRLLCTDKCCRLLRKPNSMTTKPLDASVCQYTVRHQPHNTYATRSVHPAPPGLHQILKKMAATAAFSEPPCFRQPRPSALSTPVHTDGHCSPRKTTHCTKDGKGTVLPIQHTAGCHKDGRVCH